MDFSKKKKMEAIHHDRRQTNDLARMAPVVPLHGSNEKSPPLSNSRTRRTPLLGQLFMPVRKKVQIDKKNCLTTSFIFGESTLSGSILEVV
jgi:hypothetical protein